MYEVFCGKNYIKQLWLRQIKLFLRWKLLRAWSLFKKKNKKKPHNEVFFLIVYMHRLFQNNYLSILQNTQNFTNWKFKDMRIPKTMIHKLKPRAKLNILLRYKSKANQGMCDVENERF